MSRPSRKRSSGWVDGRVDKDSTHQISYMPRIFIQCPNLNFFFLFYANFQYTFNGGISKHKIHMNQKISFKDRLDCAQEMPLGPGSILNKSVPLCNLYWPLQCCTPIAAIGENRIRKRLYPPSVIAMCKLQGADSGEWRLLRMAGRIQ